MRCHVGQGLALPALLYYIKRLLTADADYSDAASALRGRDGADGVTCETG
jgi:hypothetical protein